MPRDTEYEIAEANYEARSARNAHRCQCDASLPMHCPGPAACPYSGYAEDEDEGGEFDE